MRLPCGIAGMAGRKGHSGIILWSGDRVFASDAMECLKQGGRAARPDAVLQIRHFLTAYPRLRVGCAWFPSFGAGFLF